MQSRALARKKLVDSYLKNKRTHQKPGGHTLFTNGVVMIRNKELIHHTQNSFTQPVMLDNPRNDQESNVLNRKKSVNLSK